MKDVKKKLFSVWWALQGVCLFNFYTLPAAVFLGIFLLVAAVAWLFCLHVFVRTFLVVLLIIYSLFTFGMAILLYLFSPGAGVLVLAGLLAIPVVNLTLSVSMLKRAEAE